MHTIRLASLATATVAPRAVLNFWFDDAWATPAMHRSNKEWKKMNPLWWGISPTYKPLSAAEHSAIDATCQQFAALVRACGTGTLRGAQQWEEPDGIYASMLLTDQLARNCFRGTPEAFAYDEAAIGFARRLFAEGEGAYLTYDAPVLFTFLTTPAQHSEQLADHEMNRAICARMEELFGADAPVVVSTKNSIEKHRRVLARFGRYPHRNAALGRANTAEEQAWLDDVENLPGFAKSQLVPPKAASG